MTTNNPPLDKQSSPDNDVVRTSYLMAGTRSSALSGNNILLMVESLEYASLDWGLLNENLVPGLKVPTKGTRTSIHDGVFVGDV